MDDTPKVGEPIVAHAVKYLGSGIMAETGHFGLAIGCPCNTRPRCWTATLTMSQGDMVSLREALNAILAITASN